MISVRNGEYLGLPVPTKQENSFLDSFCFGGSENLVVPDLHGLVIARRPLIQKLAVIDKVCFFNSSLRSDFSPREQQEFEQGIGNGYDFMINALTFAWFLRSDETDPAAYVSNLPDSSIALPLKTTSQANKFRKFISERIHAEIASAQPPAPGLSDEQGKSDAQNYFENAELMDELLVYKISLFGDEVPVDVNDDTEEPLQARIYGFQHGAENCISMYIQSNEQAMLEGIWEASSGEMTTET